MQIRKRKGKLEFLRYDSEASKAAGRSIQKWITPAEFTPEERKQFDEYVAQRETESIVRQNRERALYASGLIEDIAYSVEQGYEVPDVGVLYENLDRLKKALRKAGYTRPAKPAQPADTKTPQMF